MRLRDGKFLYRRATGRFNGESFWEFLKFLRAATAITGRRIVLISVSGNSLVGSASTTVTLDSWKRSSKRSRASLRTGKNPTIPFTDYARLFKTLCLKPRLKSLSKGDLKKVEGYEKRHKNRKGAIDVSEAEPKNK